jgi:hypothetical protein
MFEFDRPRPLFFPEDAKDILEWIMMVLSCFEFARIRVVAGGGVLRDLHLDRPYKDIDLFLNAADASDEKVITMLRGMGFTSRVVVSNEATEYLEFTDVASVIEATHPNLPVPLQVVRMSSSNLSGEEMIRRLDLGPCQVGMDHRGLFWYTDQFLEDVLNGTFTVTRDERNDVARSVKRFERLSQKYPGWKLVMP